MLEILKNTITQILSAYSQYVGYGMYMILVFVAILFLYVQERDKEKRALLCHYPLLALAVIFNPLIAYIMIKFVEEYVYWRFFWIVPVTVIISYASAVTVHGIPMKRHKVVVTIALIAIMIASGKFIFTTENYTKSPNWFKLPTQTIEVCRIIENDCSSDIRAVVPLDLTVSIRQYDANIKIVYGRDGKSMSYDEKYVPRSNLNVLMNETPLNVALISAAMREFECNYLVLQKTAQFSDKMENYGYLYVSSTETYDIYRFNYENANSSV